MMLFPIGWSQCIFLQLHLSERKSANQNIRFRQANFSSNQAVSESCLFDEAANDFYQKVLFSALSKHRNTK